MATSSINASSFGSGLDVTSLVTQLVAAERSAPDARLNTAQSKAQTRISALGVLKSALSNLQTVAKTLVDGNSKDQLLATAEADGVTGVTVDNNKTEIATKIVQARKG